jgi:wyosine [tRNA(Phe)-imidazoG37] synthetase (radical SAM superfamily)
MGFCAKCRDFFPPDVMVDADDGDKLCLFCQRDQKEIRYGKNDEFVVGRKEIVEEYKIFMKQLKEKKDVAKALMGKAPVEKEEALKVI